MHIRENKWKITPTNTKINNNTSSQEKEAVIKNGFFFLCTLYTTTGFTHT